MLQPAGSELGRWDSYTLLRLGKGDNYAGKSCCLAKIAGWFASEDTEYLGLGGRSKEAGYTPDGALLFFGARSQVQRCSSRTYQRGTDCRS